MPTDTGGDVNDNTSQNQNSAVDNQSQSGKPAPKRDPVISARDELLARMDEQIIEARTTDDETFFQTADPRALAMAAEMGRESRGEQISTDRTQGRGRVEEARPAEQDVRASDAAARQVQVASDGTDPLAEFVVKDAQGRSMFKTVVDGQVRLVPLDKARATLQKHLAADIRLQQAGETQRQLEIRERNIQQAEANIRARSAAPVVPVDDATLDREATELVRSLVSQPESVAAKKMSDTLKKIRASVPQVDTNAIVRQAVTVARQEIAAESHQEALVSGLTTFTSAYPDIAADSDLYALADRKTNAIAAENPKWSPEQVMMEAGKQVRDWVAGISGKKPATPNGQGQPSTRQQVKQNLKPMPQSRSARPAPANDANADQSPQDAVREMMKARGQAY